MKRAKIFSFLFILLLPSVSSFAVWVWSPETGKFVNPENAVQDTAEEQYAYAMRFYKQRDLEEAADQLENLLKKYPGSKIAPEAQYRLGTIYEDKADFWKAFQSYKKLIESYPQSERFSEVMERQFRIGNLFLSGKKAKLMGLEILPSLPRAAEVFQHIVKQAPYSDFGDKAQFHLGLTYKQWKKYSEAVEAFQQVIDQYPQSELVAKARFQLAEVAYQQSASQYRDQRALDEASQHVDRFLSRYPDSEATEKAAKLRQAIDEKNAEKNYRIGLYYEKENFVESALIYFRDVAERYPHTRWGEKSAKKLQSLEQPVAYLSEQEKEIQTDLESLQARFERTPRENKEERERLEKEIKELKKEAKSFKKEKKGTVDRREADLKRRERELKLKFKRLESKRKKAGDEAPEDYQRAMDRWHASLEAESEALEREKSQMVNWKETLGIKETKPAWDMLPFIGEEETELEKVRRIEAKKLFEVAEEKRSLLEKKETLYKGWGELSTLTGRAEVERLGLTEQSVDASLPNADQIRAQREKVKTVLDEIGRLETELESKRSLYEAQYGRSAWVALVGTPARWMAKSIDKSFSLINPFDGSGKNLESASPEQLLEFQMHLKEKIAVQQSLIDSLSQAFNAELALQEQKRLLGTLESDTKPDPKRLRKSIKALEKDIRAHYVEIDDRHRHKKELLEELERALQGEQPEGKSGGESSVSRPVAGTGKLVKAFFFGLPHEDVELTTKASSPEASARAKEIKDEVQLESLLIEAKSREILNLEKELEILRAKASLAGGYKVRSSMVRVPYAFIGEAIRSSRRLVPRKDRDEILIQRLETETARLEAFRQDLRRIEEKIETSSPVESKPVEPVAEPAQAEAPSVPAQEAPPLPAAAPSEPSISEPSVDESSMKMTIEALREKIEIERKVFDSEKALLEKQLGMPLPATGGKSSGDDELEKQLQETQDQIVELIEKEDRLEKEESEILEKRITHIDERLPKIQSKAITQDLLTERERIEERLSQIAHRQSFLAKEMERFQLNEAGTASG